MNLTAHLLLVPRLGMSGAVPLLPLHIVLTTVGTTLHLLFVPKDDYIQEHVCIYIETRVNLRYYRVSCWLVFSSRFVIFRRLRAIFRRSKLGRRENQLCTYEAKMCGFPSWGRVTNLTVPCTTCKQAQRLLYVQTCFHTHTSGAFCPDSVFVCCEWFTWHNFPKQI